MFNQSPPKNIPALDTAGLVALITSPQKAAELWQAYEDHRKAYDAYKAEIDVAAADVAKREANLVELGKQINDAAKVLASQQEAFSAQVAKVREFQRAVEDREAALAATVSEKEQEFAGRQAALDAREADLLKRKNEVEASWALTLAVSEEKEAALAAREAAVAEREANADKLAALLKSV